MTGALPQDQVAKPLLGITLMVAGYCLVPVMDGIAKHLSATYPVLQVVWGRFFFHLAILLPLLLWRHGTEVLRVRRPLAQVVRGGFLLLATILFFAAIAYMPIADALALIFISPLVVTALSPWLLGEQVGRRRWTAVLVGFLGALIIVRPGLGVFQWASLLALGAGTVYAGYLLSTRLLSGSAPPMVTLGYTALLGAVAMSLVVPWGWVAPSPGDWLLMAAMGGIAGAGHFLLIKAFEHAPASLLAPCGYSEILMATLVGYVGFGDFPDLWTWIGVAVIIASGLYITLRERQLGLRPPPPDPARRTG